MYSYPELWVVMIGNGYVMISKGGCDELPPCGQDRQPQAMRLSRFWSFCHHSELLAVYCVSREARNTFAPERAKRAKRAPDLQMASRGQQRSTVLRLSFDL